MSQIKKDGKLSTQQVIQNDFSIFEPLTANSIS